jgi:hypothetical protein
VAALVSVKGTDRESLALSLSPDFAKIIHRARSEAKRGKISSLKQVKEELLRSSASNTTKTRTGTKSRHTALSRKKREPKP